MAVNLQDELVLILRAAGYEGDGSLLAMHLGEIEQETENVHKLFAVLRSHAYRNDREATQEALAELAVALEHALHHVQEALPVIQHHLDIAP